MSAYNVFPRSAATRASLRFSFSSAAAMPANLCSSCCFCHSTDPLAYSSLGPAGLSGSVICSPSDGSGSMMPSPSLRQPARMNPSASSVDSSSVPSEATWRCLLDAPIAQCETQVDPNRVLDDHRREAMAAVRDFSHRASLPGAALSRRTPKAAIQRSIKDRVHRMSKLPRARARPR
jgi:hypothetical protein